MSVALSIDQARIGPFCLSGGEGNSATSKILTSSLHRSGSTDQMHQLTSEGRVDTLR